MKERFNFYDVYGYLIPGFVLLGLLWLPFWLASGNAPSLGFANALGGLFVAYVLGHLLSSVTAAALPSGRRLTPDDIRLPSDDMLDRKLGLNPEEYIDKLEEKVKEFGIDLSAHRIHESERVKLGRRAFLLCRDRLVLAGKGAYAEQFEGMYTMMRGIAGAGLLSVYYLFGWLVGGIRVQLSQDQWSGGDLTVILACLGLVFVGLDFWLGRSWRNLAKWKSVVAKPQAPNASTETATKHEAAGVFTKMVRWVGAHYPAIVFWFWAVTASYAGFLLSRSNPSLDTRPGFVVGLAAVAVFLAGRCYASYEYFAKTFAETVYRNFLALPKDSPQKG